jgi:hypothetical protein
VTSVVYESCLILIEKYVLVFHVSCGFSVDFSFMTVFSDRSLDPDFLGHNFSQSLTQSILIFSHPVLNLHPVRAQRTLAQRAPCYLRHSSIFTRLLLFSAPVKPCAAKIFSSPFPTWVFACLFSCEQTTPKRV